MYESEMVDILVGISEGNYIVEQKQVQKGLSYNEILKICNWLNFDTDNRVFKGSMDYIKTVMMKQMML